MRRYRKRDAFRATQIRLQDVSLQSMQSVSRTASGRARGPRARIRRRPRPRDRRRRRRASSSRLALRCASSRRRMKCVMKRKPALAALQLAEQHVVGLERLRDRLQVADVARLPQHRGVADHGEAVGIELGQPCRRRDRTGRRPVDRVRRMPVSLSKIDTAITGRAARRRGAQHVPRRSSRSRRATADDGEPRPATGGTVERLGRRLAARQHRRDLRSPWNATGAMNLKPRFGNRLDESRVVAAVAERRANLREAVGEAAIEIDVRVLAPHRVAQLLAADDRRRRATAAAPAPSPAAARAPRRARSCAARSISSSNSKMPKR